MPIARCICHLPRIALTDSSQGLAAALEEKSDPKKIITTVRSLQVEKAKQELAEAQLIAARRSGARGAKARQVLIEKEKAVEDAQRRYVFRLARGKILTSNKPQRI